MQYTYRIELHKAPPQAYEDLHSNALAWGITRVFETKDGRRLQLPTGTYTGAAGSVEEALENGRRAAESLIYYNFEVVVTGPDGCMSYGLPAIAPSPAPSISLAVLMARGGLSSGYGAGIVGSALRQPSLAGSYGALGLGIAPTLSTSRLADLLGK